MAFIEFPPQRERKQDKFAARLNKNNKINYFGAKQPQCGQCDGISYFPVSLFASYFSLSAQATRIRHVNGRITSKRIRYVLLVYLVKTPQ